LPQQKIKKHSLPRPAGNFANQPNFTYEYSACRVFNTSIELHIELDFVF
jgi:hypothetical protein